MMNTKYLGWSVMIAAFVMVGCGDKAGTIDGDKGVSKRGSRAVKPHAHGKGPNGGVVFDLGKYHAEFTVDHSAKEATVLFLEGDDEKASPLPVAAEELTLMTKETKTKEGKVVPPISVKLLPRDAKDGKAARFVGTDPGIGNVADFEGSVTGKVNGKPTSGEFKE